MRSLYIIDIGAFKMIQCMRLEKHLVELYFILMMRYFLQKDLEIQVIHELIELSEHHWYHQSEQEVDENGSIEFPRMEQQHMDVFDVEILI